MIKKRGIIETEVEMSNDEKYRYSLKRTWKEEGVDIKKKHAAVVMLNPSEAELFFYDQTVMHVQNYLVQEGFSGMTVVNLFAYMSTPQSGLKNREEKYEKENTKVIYRVCQKADTIIIGWTRHNYITRKREVERLLYEFADKTLCFIDEKGRKLRHPVNLNEKTWTLDYYHFPLLG